MVARFIIGYLLVLVRPKLSFLFVTSINFDGYLFELFIFRFLHVLISGLALMFGSGRAEIIDFELSSALLITIALRTYSRSEATSINRIPRKAPRRRKHADLTGGLKPLAGHGRTSSLRMLRLSPKIGSRAPALGKRMNSQPDATELSGAVDIGSIVNCSVLACVFAFTCLQS